MSTAAKYTLSHAISGVTIEQRAVDGYFDATAMCRAHGKLFGNYRQRPSTQEFLAALSSNICREIIDLVQSTPGRRTGGTWVHPRVALHLAQWLSPQFAVLVTGWVEEWSTQPLFREQVREQAPSVAPVIEQIGNHRIDSVEARILEARIIDLEFRRKAWTAFREFHDKRLTLEASQRQSDLFGPSK